MRMLISRIALVIAALFIGSLPARAAYVAPPPVMTVFPPFPSTGPISFYDWVGAYINRTFVGGYGGAVGAFNGNVYSDGFLLRLDMLGGEYKYNTTAFPNTHVPMVNGDVMIGYRKMFGQAFVTGYVGAAFENHDNDDPTARLRGAEGGGKVLGEVYTPITSLLDLYAYASYATPFRTYQVYGMLGFLIADRIRIGPEAGTNGNEAYHEEKVGGIVRIEFPTFGRLNVSAGYYTPHASGGSGLGTQPGAYVNIYLGFDFHAR